MFGILLELCSTAKSYSSRRIRIHPLPVRDGIMVTPLLLLSLHTAENFQYIQTWFTEVASEPFDF